MGTETSYQSPIELLYHHQEVKLNNPLMGTESLKRGEKYERDLHTTGVKLNNPLVGSETLVCYSSYTSFLIDEG